MVYSIGGVETGWIGLVKSLRPPVSEVNWKEPLSLLA